MSSKTLSFFRSSSRHSIDSIAREKLEEALSSRPEAQSTRPPEPCPPLGKLSSKRAYSFDKQFKCGSKSIFLYPST